jgi:putative FmdB family regulatory protein
MPLYEYQCAKCGAVTEALQRFSDKPLSKCTHCSGKLHKLISHSAFHLKGSGWYVTDYAGKSKSSSPKPDSTKSTASDASNATGSGSSSTESAA